jgi:hypothetical protein
MTLWKPLTSGACSIAACAALLLTSTAVAGSTGARAARSTQVNDTAKLHVVGGSGSTLVEEGRGTGTLPGAVRIKLTLGVSTATSQFTISVSGGSLSGHASGRLHAGGGGYASFGGSLSLSKGTGRYAHASGTGSLYGVINRDTQNLTVQVLGHLHT